MNEFQRLLLQAARERIEVGADYFLCIALESAYEYGNYRGSIENRDSLLFLKDAIQRVMGGYYTFDQYIYATHGCRSIYEGIGIDWHSEMTTIAPEITYFPRSEFRTFMRNARLAWIDRMLDTNEVK